MSYVIIVLYSVLLCQIEVSTVCTVVVVVVGDDDVPGDL